MRVIPLGHGSEMPVLWTLELSVEVCMKSAPAHQHLLCSRMVPTAALTLAKLLNVMMVLWSWTMRMHMLLALYVHQCLYDERWHSLLIQALPWLPVQEWFLEYDDLSS